MIYLYKGDRKEPREFMDGIPARDVDSSELSKEQVAVVEASPLYERQTDKPQKGGADAKN